MARKASSKAARKSRIGDLDSPHYEIYLQTIEKVGSEVSSYRPGAIRRPDVEALHAALKQRRLVIVLGAGMSVPLRLLNWTQLNEALFKSVLPPSFSRQIAPFVRELGTSAPILTRFVESELSLRSELKSRLKENLYRDFDERVSSRSMKAVLALLNPKLTRPAVSTVITYNFDDMLELAIKKEIPSLKFDSVVNAQSFATSSRGLRIYHPHGFLPAHADSKFGYLDMPMVFSEPEFHDQYARATSWENVVQSFVFGSQTCLFLGTSLSDPNLRRHLDFARSALRGSNPEPRHFAVCGINTRSRSQKLATLINYFREKDMLSLGVKPLWVSNFETGIPRLLKRIATGA